MPSAMTGSSFGSAGHRRLLDRCRIGSTHRCGLVVDPLRRHFHSCRTERGLAENVAGFVVELVFAIPGLGRYFVQAVQQLDYTVIMGTTVFYGAFLVFMVILVDLLYGLIDPRVRLT